MTSTWPPKQLRLAKHSFLVIRAIKPPSDDTAIGTIETDSSVPLPTDWQEQEVRLIHTPEYTWSLPSNTLFTQQVLKTWITKDKKWHITLMQKHILPFEYPQLTVKDILFSEKEFRKVGKWNGITWMSSEKGFRLVLNHASQFDTLMKNKMLD